MENVNGQVIVVCVFVSSLPGVRTILIGFKFPPEHQNAKYVHKKLTISDMATSIAEPLACFSRVRRFLFI